MKKRTLIIVILGALLTNSNCLVAQNEPPTKLASDYYQDGLNYLENGKLEDAADAFESAFRIRPGSEKIHHALGKILVERHSDPKYFRVIELFGEMDSPSLSSRYWAARAYLGIGDPDDALDQLEQIDFGAGFTSRYVSEHDVREMEQTALEESRKKPQWWVELVTIVVVLAGGVGFVVVLRRWVFSIPDEWGRWNYGLNVLLFFVVVLVLVFVALGMGWIDADHFVEVIKTIIDRVNYGAADLGTEN